MPALSAASVLDLWEGAIAASPIDRATAILTATWPELSAAEAAELSVGVRDRLLLAARATSFGAMLNGRARCKACDGDIDLAFDIGQALAEPAAPPQLAIEAGGASVTCRRPAVGDLAALSRAGLWGAEASRFLVERCLITRPPQVLADETVEAIGEAIVGTDPWAELVLEADCPDCGARVNLLLDPASVIWADIEARAQNLLAVVARLARAFGWREADILALSEPRRRGYLAMAGA